MRPCKVNIRKLTSTITINWGLTTDSLERLRFAYCSWKIEKLGTLKIYSELTLILNHLSWGKDITKSTKLPCDRFSPWAKKSFRKNSETIIEAFFKCLVFQLVRKEDKTRDLLRTRKKANTLYGIFKPSNLQSSLCFCLFHSEGRKRKDFGLKFWSLQECCRKGQSLDFPVVARIVSNISSSLAHSKNMNLFENSLKIREAFCHLNFTDIHFKFNLGSKPVFFLR